MKKFLIVTLLAASLGTASHLVAAEKTTDDVSAPWKFSAEVKIDSASRNIHDMSKLELVKGSELVKQPVLLQGHIYSDERILFVTLRFDAYDQSVAFPNPKLSHFQFGYGDLYPMDEQFHTSTNGSGWETPNVAYIKFCKDF